MQPIYGNQDNKVDYLYRVSLKCVIINDKGEVLVVKESGRNYWDLPGGAIDHGDTIESAIARELNEEVGYSGGFTYKIIDLEEPEKLVTRDIWQVRIILRVKPELWSFTCGADSDEVVFIDHEQLKDSEIEPERLVYRYTKLEA